MLHSCNLQLADVGASGRKRGRLQCVATQEQCRGRSISLAPQCQEQLSHGSCNLSCSRLPASKRAQCVRHLEQHQFSVVHTQRHGFRKLAMLAAICIIVKSDTDCTPTSHLVGRLVVSTGTLLTLPRSASMSGHVPNAQFKCAKPFLRNIRVQSSNLFLELEERLRLLMHFCQSSLVFIPAQWRKIGSQKRLQL
jgi:hypothetical protein